MGFSTAYRHFRWVVWFTVATMTFVGFGFAVMALHNRSSAPKLLRHALMLGDLNNWPEAEREFRSVAGVFRKNGEHRGELYTRLAIIRATAQRRNLHDAVAEIDEVLRTEPLLKSDRELRMFALIIRGDFDGEMKSAAMRKDWEEVSQLAKQIGNFKWQNRARAEIGFAAFYDGDIATAKKYVLTSLVIAIGTRDVGEQIKLLYAMGLGLANSKNYADAIRFLDR